MTNSVEMFYDKNNHVTYNTTPTSNRFTPFDEDLTGVDDAADGVTDN